MRAAAEETHKPTKIGRRKGSRKGSLPRSMLIVDILKLDMFQSSIDSKIPRLERFNATTWKEAAVRLTYSESQGSNPILRLRHAQILLFKNTNTNINTHTDPILRLRHAQILLFTPFFLRNICNGGWI